MPSAVQDSNTDLELRHLTVEVARHEALAEQFHTMRNVDGKGLLATDKRA